MLSETERANMILKLLQRTFEAPKWFSSKSSDFQTLVATVISQNTSDRNADRAFSRLSEKFSITPQALSEADLPDIEEALKIAGLYRNKARIIKRLAKAIMERFGGSLDFIRRLPLEESRKLLLELPGVGPKTADVLLLFRAGKPTIPVDTHIKRVSKRLGFVSQNADYEEIRESLQALYDPKDYFEVHILLIMLGRKYCKARNPKCAECPVNRFCMTGSKMIGNA